MIPRAKNHKTYATSRTKAIEGLLTRGVFMPSILSDTRGHRIYGCPFVEYVKYEGAPEAYEKSHFIVQGFDDQYDFRTHALTVMRASQRLLLSTAPVEDEF